MELANELFSSGKFRLPNHYEDLTKEYLFLSNGQNELITSNLAMEPMFKRLERQGKSKHISTLKNQIVKSICELRVAQCPVFSGHEQGGYLVQGDGKVGECHGFQISR